MAAHPAVLEYLATTKIGEKGQLTVPKQYREDLGLETGAPFAVLRMGAGLFLIPEQQRMERLCEEIGGVFLAAGATADSLLKTLPLVRQRLFEEHYGALPAKPKAASRRTARKPSAK
jgi:AbrB family looped-hinge helix DNA binding protein